MTRDPPRRVTRSNTENDSNVAANTVSGERSAITPSIVSESKATATNSTGTASMVPVTAAITNVPSTESTSTTISTVGSMKDIPHSASAPAAKVSSNVTATATGAIKKVPVSKSAGLPPVTTSRHEGDLLAMERRIMLLERALKERDMQNEVLKVALQNNGANSSSSATAHADVAAPPVSAPPVTAQPVSAPPSTQPLSVPPVAVNTNTIVEPNNFMPISSAVYNTANMPINTAVYNTANMPSISCISSVGHTSYVASTIPLADTWSHHSSNGMFRPISANTGNGNMQFISHGSIVPRKIIDLPEFSGKAEDWPLFHTALVESTAAYGYTNFENNQRLHKSLKGEAREVVKALLIHPNNVRCIIEQLQFRFGRPEQLIRSQLAKVQDIAPIPENALGKLVPFATKVKNICAFLQSANGDHHLANPTLLDELVTKLPTTKRVEWAMVAARVQPRATVVHFNEWISSLANVICTVYDDEAKCDTKRRVVLHVDKKPQQKRCPICQGGHKAFECKTFIEATVADRWKEAKSRRLCFACLNAGHATRDCQRRKTCAINGCPRVHHKLLHEGNSINNMQSASSSSDNVHDTHAQAAPRSQHNRSHTAVQGVLQRQQASNDTDASVLSCSANAVEGKLLFRILPVTLHGTHKRIDTYALLDEGSFVTMLDDTLAQELGLNGQQQRLNIQWFGGQSAQETSVLVDLFINGRGKAKKHKLRNVYTVSNLQLPSQTLQRSDLRCDDKYLRQLPVQPYTGVKPKLLIALDHCHLGLPSATVRMRENGPFAANTELGWVVFGPTSHCSPTTPLCLLANHVTNEFLHNLVEEYFAVESFGVRPSPPIECAADIRAKSILSSVTRRISDKRFQTGLIWKLDNVQLPSSYSMALRRLVGIEKHMKRDANFAVAYKGTMDSYVAKGYARQLEHPEASVVTPHTWYLPHFAVVNPNKPSKLRMVFDAAAEVSGVSLNSMLLKGPQELRPLPSILFHFREGAVGVTGDIKEMFHQVVMQPEDRCAQRFLWRDGDAGKEPNVYEMCVMTFGAACSPCTAQYVKTRNALEHANYASRRAIKAITDYHYVDDLVDSFDTYEEAISIVKEVRSIHLDAGFELRNFASNSTEVVTALDGSEGKKPISSKEGLATEKVLGLYWQPSADKFMFNLQFNRVDPDVVTGSKRPTKRELLSVVMSIFDPLGFLCQFVVGAKLLMREVWRQNIRWDEPLTDNLFTAWERWRKQLATATEYAIPRFYFSHGKSQNLQLHIFVDASEDAFAAVAYWRTTASQNEVHVSLICAKSKCAPIKPLTVPRLELQAAVLGTRLMQTILEEHSVVVNDCFLWSDSSTVMKWIRSEYRRYKPFVQHRVAEILASTNSSNWRWVPTAENVADEATRFNNQVDFGPAARWIHGPPFLRLMECDWPIDEFLTSHQDEHDEELRPKYTMVIVSNQFIDFNRFSIFSRLVRTTAWVIHFINLCRNRNSTDRTYGPTSAEINAATLLLCRIAQNECFSPEIQQIKDKNEVGRKSPLRQLSPYIDEEGTLRVCGRIDAASWLPISARRPIILPANHTLTKLIVAHHHNLMCHQNIEATICAIRQTYWVPRLRNVLRSVIASCQICRIRAATPAPPLMGPLPADRLTAYVRPFSYTGLDYFGPLNVRVRRSTEKRWVALFTCLTVRAVHLELAQDLSTDSCIIAIRNFINRRGVPVRIRSDNGKNFVGADNEAKRFHEVFDCQRVQGKLASKGVEWVFNTPCNPAEGGAWERLVQSVKRVLHHTLKEIAPREHTLNCFLIEAESVVNSRPLTHLPISVEQEQPLTPNDFLLGSPSTAHTPTVTDISDNRCVLRQQWRISRQLRDHFWKRWVSEYLPTLTRRVKWCERTHPIKQGDLVFICDPNVPRREWCRGKVEQLYPGPDGITRRVDIRTANGMKRRAVSKLAILDVEVGEAGRFRGWGCHSPPLFRDSNYSVVHL